MVYKVKRLLEQAIRHSVLQESLPISTLPSSSQATKQLSTKRGNNLLMIRKPPQNLILHKRLNIYTLST